MQRPKRLDKPVKKASYDQIRSREQFQRIPMQKASKPMQKLLQKGVSMSHDSLNHYQTTKVNSRWIALWKFPSSSSLTSSSGGRNTRVWHCISIRQTPKGPWTWRWRTGSYERVALHMPNGAGLFCLHVLYILDVLGHFIFLHIGRRSADNWTSGCMQSLKRKQALQLTYLRGQRKPKHTIRAFI